MVVRKGIGAEGANAIWFFWLVNGTANQENLRLGRLAQLRASCILFNFSHG